MFDQNLEIKNFLKKIGVKEEYIELRRQNLKKFFEIGFPSKKQELEPVPKIQVTFGLSLYIARQAASKSCIILTFALEKNWERGFLIKLFIS